MRGFILSLMLTASNPEEAGVDFSLEDLKRGVYIPEREEEAYAVGLAYSYAYMPQYPSNSVLVFEGRKRDRAFFKHISTVMEEIYNIRSEERVINRPPSTQVLGGKVKRF
ncbi:MAG: hypothetical protein GWO20_08325, partial [Candidatus Korarchaeota archaeon]|nr:hypothetical protein [Candidatus Korarchaeota archaeon]NIU82022.1 hypothetical protein [Candidatus Thorarchaeota archaeon]NIW51957.1 hypothetical protein [Candidatus Korarchaeota archaeon]